MAENVISTERLTKYFGSKRVLDQVDLRVPRGSVFAFLGRNGSGKTTTIRVLLGLEPPTRGRAQILGCDSQRLTSDDRARIGYLTEGHVAYGWMTVRECERFQRGSFPKWNTDIFRAVVSHFGLSPDAHIRDLSRGERAGVCLAMTLAPEPELLILDDPALGLDPVARRALLEAMLYVTRGAERTILFSSHLIHDVERVADHVAILDRGVLRVQCRSDEFREHVATWVVRFEKSVPQIPSIDGLLGTTTLPNELRLTVVKPQPDIEDRLRQLGDVEVERVPVALEDAVLSYMDDHGRRRSLLHTIGDSNGTRSQVIQR